MLLDFEFGNFRSFKDGTNLSMVASRQTTFNERLIRSYGIRVLPSMVIYGANASGKSNVIKALSCLCDIVSLGNLSAEELTELELCPFAYSEKNEPLSFNIDFINNNHRYRYKLQVLVTAFSHNKKTVKHEKLCTINKSGKETLLFERDNKEIRLPVDSGISDDISKKLNSNLDESVLFLTGGFKNVISSETADEVISFFADKLRVIDNFSSAGTRLLFKKNAPPSNYHLWNKWLDIFFGIADFGPQKMFFGSSENDDDNEFRLYSVYNNCVIPSILMESRGTLKMIDVALILQKIIAEGGTLVIDEFDNALHPELVKGIISLFGDKDINKNGAQLIFTTHNPIYLNNKIFRRDQIAFTEKDCDSYCSTLYTLADFGSETVRNDESYLINYFKGKYTSMPFVDFARFIKEAGKNDETT